MRNLTAHCRRVPEVRGHAPPPEESWVAWTDGSRRFVMFGPSDEDARIALERRIYDVLGSRYRVVFRDQEENQ